MNCRKGAAIKRVTRQRPHASALRGSTLGQVGGDASLTPKEKAATAWWVEIYRRFGSASGYTGRRELPGGRTGSGGWPGGMLRCSLAGWVLPRSA